MKTSPTQSTIRSFVSAGIIAIAIAISSVIGSAGDASARTNELRAEHASATGVRAATSTTPAGADSYLHNRIGLLSE